MNMSEKLAALSDPEYGNHYSSLPDGEIHSLWDTTRLKDTERYFIYREILARGLEAHLLCNQKNKRKFLWGNEYLIAEYKEGWWANGGFATYSSSVLFFVFPWLPIIILAPFAQYVLNSGKSVAMIWATSSWLIIFIMGLLALSILSITLWATDSLIHSYLILTNQRIGYYFKVARIFKLPLKWIDFNDGHIISNIYNITYTVLFLHTKNNRLKKAYIRFRLEKYTNNKQQLCFELGLLTSIYLFEFLHLISSKTNVTIYSVPIVCLDDLFKKKLMINYRFKGCQLEDLSNFIKTIGETNILRDQNKIYMGASNMERLASFFSSKSPKLPGYISNGLCLNEDEIMLACLPGSKRYSKKSSLICLTTTRLISCQPNNESIIFEYNWGDPNLSVQFFLYSVHFLYKNREIASLYGEKIDFPIVDALSIVGIKQV